MKLNDDELDYYLQATEHSKEKTGFLNKELAKYGLTLNSTILDVYEKYQENDLIPQVLKMVSGKSMTLEEEFKDRKRRGLLDREEIEIWIDRLINEESQHQIDRRTPNFPLLTKEAFERTKENPTLQPFEGKMTVWTKSQDINECLRRIGYGVEKYYFVKQLSQQVEISHSGAKIKEQNYLKIEFEDLLNRIENQEKIQKKVEQWKSGKDKIGCAAFVEMLYNRKYLENGNNNRQRCIQFAKHRYRIDIKNQITSSKNTDRKKHEMYFKKCFE